MADNSIPPASDPWADFRADPATAPAADPWAEFRVDPSVSAAAEPSVLGDVAKAAIVGPAKGLIGLPGLPGDLGALRDAGIDKLHRFLLGITGFSPEQIEAERARFNKIVNETPTPFSRFPKALTSADIQNAVEKATGAFPEAQTGPGQAVQTIGEFLPTALTGGEGAVANALKGAVAPGVGSTIAANAPGVQGTWLEGPAKFGGAVIGGLAGHGTDVARAAAKTYGAQREVAKDVGSLVGEPAVNAGAVSRMAKDVANDQLTPEGAAARVQALGPDEAMMLDMGRQLQQRAESIAGQPGKGQNTILNAVQNRTGIVDFHPVTGRLTSSGEGTAARMQEMMDHELGQSPDVVKLGKRMGDIIDQYSTPLYNKVMNAHPVVDVPADVTSRPAVSAAMKDAPIVARNYGEKLESPRPPEELDVSGPGYQMYKDQPPAEPAKTSLRYWDYVKKSMDQRIRSYYQNGGASELGSADKADLGGLQAARTALVTHLDEVTGGAYKQARDVAATKPQLQDALDDGRGALNTKLLPEEMADAYQNMSIPQQTMYKAGMRREIDRIVDTARNDAAAARNVLNTNQNRDKIATMFGEGTAQRIDDQIAAETKFQQATTNIAGNSRTAVRQQLMKDTEAPSISRPPQASMLGFATKGVNKLGDLIATGMLENTRTGLGAMSVTPGRDVPDLVRLLSGYNQRAAANARPPIGPPMANLARVLALKGIRDAATAAQQPQSPGR